MRWFILLLPIMGLASIENTFKEISTIENPFSLRDPFQKPIVKRNFEKKATGKKNIARERTSEDLKINEMVVVGVLVGVERRAFVKSSATAKEGDVMVLKEGQRVGSAMAEVKAIHPGGIIIVEKITNIYGQAEYLETVIPISQQ